MAALEGDIRVLKIRRVGEADFKQVGFLLVNNWQKNTSMLPTTTRNDAGFRTQIPLEKSASISFTAVVFEDQDYVNYDRITYKELMQIHEADEQIEWLLIAEGKNLAHAGKAYITALNEGAPHKEFVQMDGVLDVFGRWYEFNDTEPPTAPVLTLEEVDSLPTPFARTTWTMATDNFGIACYELHKFNGTNWQRVVFDNVLEYVDTALMLATFYAYRVRAKDLNGNLSPWSNVVKFSLPIPSGMPTPKYKLHQDGTAKLHQNGVPKQYQG